MAVTRSISVSEASALFDCEARHAFAYTGHLTGGDTLRAKTPAITLRRGRAWGAAVAAWHTTSDDEIAVDALRHALDQDAIEQQAAGVYVYDEHVTLLTHLMGVLRHYTATADRIPLHGVETKLRAALPSRTGRRPSNRYVFEGYVDGLHRDQLGLWIVEFKLRGQLSSFEQVAWSRQVRWYAWAAERALGERVCGVIVDERLNDTPRPARLVKAKRKDEGILGMVPSHAKDQLTTPELYRALCERYSVTPDQETMSALAARRWQVRHIVLLRRDEIDRAGRELVSAGRLIGEMDAGDRYPVANPSPFRCPGCPYREICLTPADGELIDLQFQRTVPKRHRPKETEVTAPILSLSTARQAAA